MRKPVLNEWTALNDVEVAEDGVMYWAVLSYAPDEKSDFSSTPITHFALTNEDAWNLVYTHNKQMGLSESR